MAVSVSLEVRDALVSLYIETPGGRRQSDTRLKIGSFGSGMGDEMTDKTLIIVFALGVLVGLHL
jgi:hypothetical protein